MNFPEIGSGGGSLANRVAGFIPWLPTFDCPNCSGRCEASETYDPDEAAFFAESNGIRPSWYCENCDTHYRREVDSKFTFDPWDQ